MLHDISNRLRASLRAQIGRIYYAAYLEARTWCEAHLGYEHERLGREHVEVPRLLSVLDSTLAENLAFLRTYRNTADYDLHASTDTLVGQRADALNRAIATIAQLDALDSTGSDA